MSSNTQKLGHITYLALYEYCISLFIAGTFGNLKFFYLIMP